MKPGVRFVLPLFVAAVILAGFVLPGGEREEPDLRELLAEELLGHNIVLQDYYTTNISELERALGVSIAAGEGEVIGFAMVSSSADPEVVFERTARVVLNASPELEGVAMLNIEAEPGLLVYAPRGVLDYGEMQKLRLDVERLFEAELRQERMREAVLEAGVRLLNVQILDAEKLRSLEGMPEDAREVVVLTLSAEEFGAEFWRAVEAVFRADRRAEVLLVGNVPPGGAEAVRFYLLTRERYEEGNATLEELPSVEVDVR
ncbi:MAG: hypothetical protein GXO66_04580 [Euryarchaeota archaeon]|nr:hypothetical protein [Euryarchaeota archaeon]